MFSVVRTADDLDSLSRRGLWSNSAPLSPKQNKILNVFFYTVLFSTFFAMVGIILYLVYAFMAKNAGSMAHDWLLGIFSDFVFIMDISLEESPYIVEESSYPPFAIAILKPFALICKNVFASYSGTFLTVDELTSRVILHPEFWVSIVLFFLVCSLAIIVIVTRLYRLEPLPSLKVALITVASAPFIFAVMRGNTIYFAFIFLLLFLLLYEHPKAWVREIAYLCLVVAGLIKIYPLFFGVYLLHKKRIFASVRIGVYYFALFAISFFLFDGGLEDFLPFVENLGGFASNEARFLKLNNLSITSFIYRIFYIISPDLANGTVFSVVNYVILGITLLIATVAGIGTRSSFTRSAIAASIVILVPSISYFYVLVFMLIPFLEYLKSYDSFGKVDRRIYTTTFMFIFCAITLLPQAYLLHTVAVFAMLAIECRRSVKNDVIPYFKNKKAVKA